MDILIKIFDACMRVGYFDTSELFTAIKYADVDKLKTEHSASLMHALALYLAKYKEFRKEDECFVKQVAQQALT
jgi:hypothetical protein